MLFFCSLDRVFESCAQLRMIFSTRPINLPKFLSHRPNRPKHVLREQTKLLTGEWFQCIRIPWREFTHLQKYIRRTIQTPEIYYSG